MSVGEEAGGGLARAVEVLDQDAVGVESGGRPCGEDDGHVPHRAGQVLLPAARRDDDQPFDLVVDEPVDEAGFPVGLLAGVAEQHAEAVLRRDLLDAEREP